MVLIFTCIHRFCFGTDEFDDDPIQRAPTFTGNQKIHAAADHGKLRAPNHTPRAKGVGESLMTRVTFTDVPKHSFAEHVRKLHDEHNTGFQNEFDTIQMKIARESYPSEQSRQFANVGKNRFSSIFACGLLIHSSNVYSF